MSTDTSAVLLQRLLELEERKDSIEFGPANGRIKVYVNSRDEAESIKNIQTMINLRSFAEVALPHPVAAPAKEANTA
jgi:hypothetical protein